MKLKCLLGLHIKMGLTVLKSNDFMEVTYNGGEKQKIPLGDIKMEACTECHTVFYNDN